jgi:hypothetical protein
MEIPNMASGRKAKNQRARQHWDYRMNEDAMVWQECEWLKINVGKYKNKLTLPELLFCDIDHFDRLRESGKLQGELADQALRLDQLSSRILPPRKRPRDWRFAELRNAEGTIRINIVKKTSNKAPRVDSAGVKWEELKRRQFLALDDLLYLAQSCDDERRALRRLTKSFRVNWFGSDAMPSRPQAEKFFNTKSNFDMTRPLLGPRTDPKQPHLTHVWNMLPGKQKTANRWQPPHPPTWWNWFHTPDEKKREAFAVYMRWAKEKGVLATVERYLEGLSEVDWHHAYIKPFSSLRFVN